VPTVRLTVAYDGSGFSGWARQPGLRTVQGELERALFAVYGRRERIELTVAGRTDAGVHARGQVASYESSQPVPEALARRLNGLLPDDVSVIAAGQAPDGFDARRWASSRSYRYRVLASPVPSPFETGRALWWPYPIERELLEGCAAALVGEHDFTAFTPTQTDHVRFTRRVFAAGWESEGPEAAGEILAFTIRADAFMRNMIRVLVGTMLEVGGGKRSLEDFVGLLEGAPREAAGQTAPPHGLYFEQVEFADGPVFVHNSEASDADD
jgi:tRNA pseudouridine38-40 synthase